MNSYLRYNSPIGNILLEASETALVRLCFEDTLKLSPQSQIDDVGSTLLSPAMEQTLRWLDLYFNGKCLNFFPPLSFHTSVFQRKVYELTQKIPYGSTLSYGVIAKSIAQANRSFMSAQAVGTALKNNPILLIIPCHRVVAANGALSGFAAGLDRKQWLLDFERNNFNSCCQLLSGK